MKTVRLKDAGFSIRLRIKDSEGTIVNLASATVMIFYFKKPDRSEISKAAQLYTDGSDGICYTNMTSNEINQLGIWCLQAYIEIDGGTFTSTIAKFKVEEIINN